ncbi:hypothetical protein EYR36_010003 [Pleurotus pulmonarius]|nr:hypothetical protein EYR36_010003 [Pleurotus pulmonarius]KAF4593478.1 hypothetical protein EYR38_009193 [Pleurotus pulmonarius]
MGIAELPNEILHGITGYLTKKDFLALSYVSSAFRGPAETQLYSTVLFVHPVKDRDKLEPFLNSLHTNPARRRWVHTFIVRSRNQLGQKDSEHITAILALLSRVRHLDLDFKYRVELPRLDNREHPPQLTPTDSNKTNAIRPSVVENTPLSVLDVNTEMLPNLISVRAHLSVVLRLLPGRPIQRIETDVGEWSEDPCPCIPPTAFESVQVLSITPESKSNYLWSFVAQLKNLEVLHLVDEAFNVDVPALCQTRLRFLSFRPLTQVWLTADMERRLFEAVQTLECLESHERMTEPTLYGGYSAEEVIFIKRVYRERFGLPLLHDGGSDDKEDIEEEADEEDREGIEERRDGEETEEGDEEEDSSGDEYYEHQRKPQSEQRWGRFWVWDCPKGAEWLYSWKDDVTCLG